MKKKHAIMVLSAIVVLAIFSACDNPWWPEKDIYTVTFHANGGTGTVPAAQSVVARSSITLPHGSGLTKTGYTFDGWNRKHTGDGDHHHAGSSFTPTGHITLYARWVENTTSNSEGNTPDNTGNAPGGYYNPGGGYTGGGNPGGNTNTNRPPYTVTYSPGLATGTVPPPVPGLLPGTELTLPSFNLADGTPSLTLNGYTFLGWRGPDDKLYDEGGTMLVTASMLLTAAWAPNAVGLAVSTNNGSLTASNVQYYGSYSPDSPDVREDITIEATENVGPFIIDKIKRSYEVDDLEKASFDFYYVDEDGNDMEPPVFPSIRARALVKEGEPIIRELKTGEMVKLRIKPYSKYIPVGTHSLEVSIKDDNGHGATFAMTFTVRRIRLTIVTGDVIYTNPGEDFLTPIKATIGNTPYTERTASFPVTVSGFARPDDADISLNHLEIDNGVTANVNGLDLDNGVGKLVDENGVTVDDKTTFAKTWTVTVALNDTKEFSTGKALAYIGLGGFVDDTTGYYFNENYYYTYTESPGAAFALDVHDGHAPTFPQVIPVRQGNVEVQGNVEAFNIYANTTNGLKRHYIQTEDIVLTAPAPGGSNWTAIGTSAASFIGSYDGDGKTITGLTIKESSKDNQGMFGYIGAGSKVQKLGLFDVNVTGKDSVGSVVGQNGSTGTVKSCYVTGNVSGSGNNIGGVVGTNANGGTVEYCYSKDININMSLASGGGVVGSNGGTVQFCYADNPNVEAAGSNVGGIVGWSGRGGKIENCYAVKGEIKGVYYVGGIVGMTNTNASSTSTVKYCYSTCVLINTGVHSVQGTDSNCIAGIVGLNQGDGGMAPITQNNVALNPSITSTYNNSEGIGRVSGAYPNGGNYRAPTFANNYARTDMTIKYNTNTTYTPPSASKTLTGKDGADIPDNNWNSETFWQGVFGSTNNAWEFRAGLPRLNGMPGGLDAQDPEAPGA